MTAKKTLLGVVVFAGLAGSAGMAMAAPPSSGHVSRHASLAAQVQDAEAKVAAARTQNAALQAQVTQLEQQTDAQQKHLQQRDAEIASLQKQLQAAGVPAATATSGS